MILTFIDSGVLIAAARSTDALSAPALAILADANRQFVSSDFVRLEVLPKPTYFKRTSEAAFYQTYFATVGVWIPPTPAFVQRALQLASLYGLGAVDALHVTAAEIAHADELITAERPTSPLLRVTTIKAITIHP